VDAGYGAPILVALAEPFLLALLVSVVATLLCERVARRIRLVAHPREDRWHRDSVPLLGGLAIMVAVVVVGAEMRANLARFGPLLLLSVGMGAVGLVDDFKPLRPQTKLALQIVGAAVLIQLGTLLPLTSFPVVNVFLTLFWVVGITNAFNLLDNMDGLAAGVAVLAAICRLALFLIDGDPEGAWMMAGLIGAGGGFLIRNYPPAKIFMGDAGSLFLGFFMGGISLVSDYAYTRGVVAVLVFPVLLVLVPILDTAFVTVTRLLSGRSVAQGGRDHTSHRLVALGISERQALVLLLGVSAVSGLLAILSYRQGFEHSIILLALLVIGLALLGVHLARAHVVTAQTPRAGTPVIRLIRDFPYKRHIATMGIDAILIVIAYYAAYLLRFETAFETERANFLRTIGPILGLQLLALAASGGYRGLWRYTSVPDLLRLCRAATIGVGASILYLVFTIRFETLSRAVFVLDWALLILLLTGSRVAYRLLGEWLRPRSTTSRRALIYGAGDGGALTLRELRNNADLGRQAVGFLDDDRNKRGTRIYGLPVLGGLDTAEEVCAAHGVAEVIVASQKIPLERVQRLEAICTARGVLVTRASLWIE
jgi:UDP-GlcNAc:undecaprenyl-phosphate/decaprenyl-phosphate GlcNAc-1-phosphate transferase